MTKDIGADVGFVLKGHGFSRAIDHLVRVGFSPNGTLVKRKNISAMLSRQHPRLENRATWGTPYRILFGQEGP